MPLIPFMPLIPLKALYGGIRTKTQELGGFKSPNFPKSKNYKFFYTNPL
jgi:hypothetical protein